MNRDKTSRCYTYNEIISFLAIVQPGDEIEFLRGIYSHYAIYIGRDTVNGRSERHCIIHVTTTEGVNAGFFTAVSQSSTRRLGSASGQANLGKPNVESLCKYLSDKPGTKFRINNNKDDKWSPFSPWKIIQRAKEAIESWSDYDLWANNCEHFSNYCRYGVKHSDQSQAVSTVVNTAVTIGLVGGAALLLLNVFGSRERNQRR